MDAAAYGMAKKRLKGSTSPYSCGEDSFFISAGGEGGDDGEAATTTTTTTTIGVADGVGGWSKYGVNSAFIAQKMMLNSFAIARENDRIGCTQDPKEIIAQAYEKIKTGREVLGGGSTTCCVLTLDTSLPERSIIRSANIGDSQYIIVRGRQVIGRCECQRMADDSPFQLAIIPDGFSRDFPCIHTDPAEAAVGEHDVEAGDVVILASDGFWDNVPSDLCEVANLVSLLNERRAPTAKMAQALVDMALSYYVKPDDVTVVVARVVSLSNI